MVPASGSGLNSNIGTGRRTPTQERVKIPLSLSLSLSAHKTLPLVCHRRSLPLRPTPTPASFPLFLSLYSDFITAGTGAVKRHWGPRKNKLRNSPIFRKKIGSSRLSFCCKKISAEIVYSLLWRIRRSALPQIFVHALSLSLTVAVSSYSQITFRFFVPRWTVYLT